VFSSPVPLRVYCYLVDFLESQSFSPNWDRNPESSLVIFKAISGYPRCPLRELDIVQNNHHVGKISLYKEGRKRSKKWLVGRYDHFPGLLYALIRDLILANSSGVLILRKALLGQQNLRISSSLTYLTGIES
jgi:hypothetical protein